MPELVPPIEITQQVFENHVKELAAELNVSTTTIYRMLSDEGYDTYGRFLAVYRAAAKINPAGAELYFQDFQARHLSLKGDAAVKGDRDMALSDAIAILADAVRTRGNGPQFKLKAARIITVMEWLIRNET